MVRIRKTLKNVQVKSLIELVQTLKTYQDHQEKKIQKKKSRDIQGKVELRH